MRVHLVLPPSAPRAAFEAALADAGHALLPPAPATMPGVAKTERDAFLTHVDRMLEAELLVVDASEESAAVGWCVAWFLAKGRLVVLACRRDRRAALSPMLAGNPSPWQRTVLYDGGDDLRRALVDTLRS